MIYVLAGIAKAGKSLIAKEILQKHSISTFSTDYLMVVLDKVKKIKDLDIHASDRTVSKQIEPYVHALIDMMIKAEEDYVIEGVHFNPDFSNKLKQEFGNKISILYIGYKDTSVSDKVNELNSYRDKIKNQWIFDFDQPLEDTVSYLIEESKRLYSDCMLYDIPWIEIYDIDQQKEEIVKKLLQR